MKNIVTIGASTSSTSINVALARHAGSLLKNASARNIDLREFEMPIYSEDLEKEQGIPQKAKLFVDQLDQSDGIIISFAEHNGSYSSAFKNILDWASRQQKKVWGEKPVLLLSTSPGGRGGANVLAAAEEYFPHLGAEVTGTMALPEFYENFDEEIGIKDKALSSQLHAEVEKFSKAL